MSRNLIFVSTQSGYLEYMGVSKESYDFWRGYNQDRAKPYQTIRNLYCSEIGFGTDDEYLIYAIQCCECDSLNDPLHYQDKGEKYVNSIYKFIQDQLSGDVGFDNVYLILHEKDINDADSLSNDGTNFYSTDLSMWGVTQQGKEKLYHISDENFNIILFQHVPYTPVMEFVAGSVTKESICRLFKSLSEHKLIDSNDEQDGGPLPEEIKNLINNSFENKIEWNDDTNELIIKTALAPSNYNVVRIEYISNIYDLKYKIGSPNSNIDTVHSKWGISNDYIPTIHLSYKNAFKPVFLDSCRQLRFLDSSIWHYFIHISKDDLKSTKSALNHVLTTISENYNKGYYDLKVAGEYKELDGRLLTQSYIFKFGKDEEGHSAVTPFIFHSESENKERISDCGSTFLLNCNWRFLLVDDCANYKYQTKDPQGNDITLNGRPLSSLSGTSDKHVFKDDIIRDRIQEFYKLLGIEDSRIEKKPPITLDYAICIDQAIDKMKSTKYDLILLDYKLKKEEYGYNLLTKIRDSVDLQKIAGPKGKFFFMFISAYTNAVQERLRCEDFPVDTSYWFIGRGACPTNTPYLFLYCMLRMMRIRYDKLVKHSKHLLYDLSTGIDGKNGAPLEYMRYVSMTMFLTKLFEKGNERTNCVKGFNAFLNLRRVYDSIKHDVIRVDHEIDKVKSSPLILSVFKDEGVCSNSFWEHLQNLVYLTAFGTIRQWPEMWEDYTFIRTKLEKAEKEYSKELQDETMPSSLIRDYIISLKSKIS